MAKPIPASGAGAVRLILKNKADFHYTLDKEENENGRISYLYDVWYENAAGTFNIAVKDGQVIVAALNLGLGKVITLTNDANLKKLAQYVLDNPQS